MTGSETAGAETAEPESKSSKATTKIKLCGITRPADAALAATLGADFIGLNFWHRSKRFVEFQLAAELAAAARVVNPAIQIVGVFVNPTEREVETANAAAALNLIQLHGDESSARVASFGPRAFKATALKDAASVALAMSFPGPWLLVDTPSTGDYGGSGKTFDWRAAIALGDSDRPWFLAGGLSPNNVARAIKTAHPSAVDVASGVENAPGEKDESKMRAFIAAVRGCTHHARPGENS